MTAGRAEARRRLAARLEPIARRDPELLAAVAAAGRVVTAWADGLLKSEGTAPPAPAAAGPPPPAEPAPAPPAEPAPAPPSVSLLSSLRPTFITPPPAPTPAPVEEEENRFE